MKKLFALILAAILMLSLCACEIGSNEPTTPTDPEEEAVKSAVRGRAVAAMTLGYETSGTPADVTFASMEEISENRWSVSGKISVKDKYGDAYSCNYDAIVTYDPELDSADVEDFDHTTPRKS